MATVSFHLKEPKVDKPTAIFIWFNPQNGGPRVRLYTGDKIEPSLWAGGDVQRVITKGRTLDPDVKRVNEALNANNERMSRRLLTYWGECRAAGILPTAEQLRAVIEPEAAAEPAPSRPLPLPDLLAYKERHARTRRPNTVKALGTVLEKRLASSQNLVVETRAELTATTGTLTIQVQQAQQEFATRTAELAKQKAKADKGHLLHLRAVMKHLQGSRCRRSSRPGGKASARTNRTPSSAH